MCVLEMQTKSVHQTFPQMQEKHTTSKQYSAHETKQERYAIHERFAQNRRSYHFPLKRLREVFDRS